MPFYAFFEWVFSLTYMEEEFFVPVVYLWLPEKVEQ